METENDKDNLTNKNLRGIQYITPLGGVFDYHLQYKPNELSLRKAFKKTDELRKVISNAREFRDNNPNTFNGLVLGKPSFEIKGNKIEISAEQLHYYIYFAYHELRRQNPNNENETYPALSVCGVIYDNSSQCFYLSKRPLDSQEDPGKTDSPGGTLNPEVDDADPLKTIEKRFVKKLGLKPEEVKCLGVAGIFDEKYSLYNLIMYAEVDNQTPRVESERFTEIPLDSIEGYLSGDELTSPAKATLLLALSQNKFESTGWGKERVKNYIEENS